VAIIARVLASSVNMRICDDVMIVLVSDGLFTDAVASKTVHKSTIDVIDIKIINTGF